jgi:hypothetical protein
MKKIEHNIETGKRIERNFTVDEIAQLETDNAEISARLQSEVAKSAAKQAILTKLGLTADEAALLLS